LPSAPRPSLVLLDVARGPAAAVAATILDGNSGLGNTHGFYGFRAFSHERAMLEDKFSIVPMLFPPYTALVKQMTGTTLEFNARNFLNLLSHEALREVLE
jgi:hypothetical protein